MAAQIALRTWLVALGAGNDENANAIIAQGIADIQDLLTLLPEYVKTICDGARKPGGTIENVNGDLIPNPGRPVPAILQTKLTLAVNAALYFNSVGRPINGSIMAWERIVHFRNLNRA